MNRSAIWRRLSGLEGSKTEDVVPSVKGRIDYLPPVEPPLMSGEGSRASPGRVRSSLSMKRDQMLPRRTDHAYI